MSLPIPVNGGDIAPAQHSPGPLPLATPDDVDRRLDAIQQGLVTGKSTRQMRAIIQEHWGISRRSAQAYVQRAERRMAEAAEAQDQLAQVRKSLEQHDLLFAELVGCARNISTIDPKIVRSLTDVVGTALKLMNSRDKTAHTESLLAATRPGAIRAAIRQRHGNGPLLPGEPRNDDEDDEEADDAE